MSNVYINSDTSIKATEIEWRFSRSSGPGGQNVNKVSSRVTLLFDPDKSLSLTDEKKCIVRQKLARIIDGKGLIQISVEEERSQHKNREIALKRFSELLAGALKSCPKRIATNIPACSDEDRVRLKRQKSTVKKMRRSPEPESDI